MLLACLGAAKALTPLPDNSPSFFSGEWVGNGEQGIYCYLDLSENGLGWVFIDGGTGDWLGAQMLWLNKQQALQVVKITPLTTSNKRRIMPLTKFSLRSGFNQSLRLTWNAQSTGCQMQKIESMAHHLKRARSVIDGLTQGENK